MMKKTLFFIRILSELNKFRITIIVTLTTLAGYTLAAKTIDKNIILPMIGIFILACGSAAFNEFQERKQDIMMKRTQNRPIPSGNIKPASALVISILEIIIGTWILYIGSNWEAAILGFTAFIWYNLIYTPLKKITPFAVIPGSVIGAIPPMVGWTVGGGSLSSSLYLMAFFFFISQVPHFWLLMLKYGEEYNTAGFPTINAIFTDTQIRRVTFVWIVATALDIVLLAVIGLFSTLFFKTVVILAAIWLVVIFTKLLRKTDEKFNPFRYFMRLNYLILIVIIAMILDPLF